MTLLALRVLLLGAAALGASGLLSAQQSADPQRAVVEHADEVAKAFEEERITDPTVFVKSAALGTLTGIELSKLAKSKSTSADIRTFAARTLDEGQSARAELAAIAKRKRLDVPTSLIYEDEQLVTQAAAQSGAEFDAWYPKQMVTEQDKAIALFRAASNMPDAELAAFAKKTLAVLTEQQKRATALLGAPPKALR